MKLETSNSSCCEYLLSSKYQRHSQLNYENDKHEQQSRFIRSFRLANYSISISIASKFLKIPILFISERRVGCFSGFCFCTIRFIWHYNRVFKEVEAFVVN